MLILHVSGSARGGAELQLLHLLEAEKARGGEDRHVVLLVRPGPLEDQFRALGSTYVSSKSRTVDPRFILDGIRWILAERPDVVHSWGPTPNLWGPILARLAQAWPGALRRRWRPGVVMAEVGLDEWKGRVLRLADRLDYFLADAVVGNARGVTETAIARGAARQKTDTVLMGVEVPERTALGARQPVRGRVLLLGRWDWRKGHEDLIRMWPTIRRACPEATLVMAGAAHSAEEKELKATCTALVQEFEKDPVLAGSVTLLDHTDPVQALAEAEILAVSSNSEGMPNVVLEAFSRYVPVVAYDVGGIGEAVREGQTGRLVPAGDSAAFARAVVETLHDPESAAQRAEEARTWVEQLTFPASLDAWKAVYRKAVRR